MTLHVDNPRYVVNSAVLLVLLSLDVICNALSVSLFASNVALLVVFIIQSASLLGVLVSLSLQLFSTFAFKAGLLYVLLRQFAVTFIIIIVYMCLTIAYGIWNLVLRWNGTEGWNDALVAVFVIHKVLSVAYYYFCKRSVLILGDVRYYTDSQWIWNQLNKHAT